MPNLVQAEFFHVGGKGDTLENVQRECDERIAESFKLVLAGIEATPGIKTVIRFFDGDGTITAQAEEEAQLYEQERMLEEQLLSGAKWLVTLVLRFKLSRVYLKRAEAHDKRLSVTLAGLYRIIGMRGQIAVERGDHSFRLAEADEIYDLQTSASRAKGLWLFVFEPNDLHADDNSFVAYTM